MLLDIVEAFYIKDFKIQIKFEDGKAGVVDFNEYVARGGIFESLKDKNVFKSFRINKDLGTICWPSGADVAPESLYEKVTRQE